MSWLTRGFEVFAQEPAVTAWCEDVRSQAQAVVDDPALRRRWMRHGDTWFVGVDGLPNDADGRVAGGVSLGGRGRTAAEAVSGPLPLHRGQISVTYPGYPRRDPTETEASHRFRRDRDAAHLDGLLPIGTDKRRHLREFHAFILGIGLSDAAPRAAPLVVWEGSHILIRDAFRDAFAGHHPDHWPEIDVTDIYREARRAVFRTCSRCAVPLRNGETVLVHRHAIHGVAPWDESAVANPDGRAVVYFRPECPNREDWLTAP